jgi:hypothetical protein
VTTLQCARQIAFKLLARTWPDSPSGNVFANVYVTQNLSDEVAPSSIRFPFALVRVLDGTADPDDQRYVLQRFEVVLVTANQGDQFGESTLVGGRRVSAGRSTGRGVLEIEEQALAAVQFLDPIGGVNIQFVNAGTAEAVLTPDIGYVVARPLTFQARLTTTRTYSTPNAGRNLKSSVAGPNVTLTWTWHERWDLYAARTAPSQITTARGALTLIRKSGGSAPTTVSDGTVVTLSSNSAVTVVDAPGSGTWSYSLFAQFDEFGDGTGVQPMVGTSIRTSSSASVTGIVV